MVNELDRINSIKRNQVEECVKIAKSYPIVKRLIIFGSSVTDDCDDRSDLDICIDVTNCSGIQMHQLAVELLNKCDENCDIIRYHKIHGRLKQEIDEKGVVVYENIS